jgi:hypothetical protein
MLKNDFSVICAFSTAKDTYISRAATSFKLLFLKAA